MRVTHIASTAAFVAVALASVGGQQPVGVGTASGV